MNSPTHSCICLLQAVCVPFGGHPSVSKRNIITNYHFRAVLLWLTIIEVGRKESKPSLPAVFFKKAPGERKMFHSLLSCEMFTCSIKQQFLLKEDLDAWGRIVCQHGCKKGKNWVMVVVSQGGSVVLPHLMTHPWQKQLQEQNILLVLKRNLEMNIWPHRLLEEDDKISPRYPK